MKFTCECGDVFHDDTNVCALLFKVDPHTKDLNNDLFQRIYRMAVDCWEGKRKPDPFARDIVRMFEGESVRVFKCPSCGRLSWFEEVDPATEKHEYRVFKPEPVESVT